MATNVETSAGNAYKCKYCGAPLSAKVKFCPKCGNPLTWDSDNTSTATQTASSGSNNNSNRGRKKSNIGLIILLVIVVALVVVGISVLKNSDSTNSNKQSSAKKSLFDQDKVNATKERFSFITDSLEDFKKSIADSVKSIEDSINSYSLNADSSAAEISAVGSEAGAIIRVGDVFEPNSISVIETEKERLKTLAEILKSYDNDLLIIGYTAEAGTKEGQLKTSKDRAEVIANYLILYGARTADQITIEGHGAENPIGDNSTAEGKAKNRRVEITLLSKE